MAFPVKDKYLLIHGLSGALRFVSEETAQKFIKGEVTQESKPFFTHLTPEEEAKKAESLCKFLMKRAATCADSTLAVTYDCNLRCPYCYEIWVKHPEMMSMVMDEYKVDKAFEALEDLNKECSGKKLLTLTGGEPFMKKNKDIVEYILKKGDNLGYTFIIFTNGVELHHFLSQLSAVSVEFVQITLDGPPSLHDTRRVFKRGKGTFDSIAKNIEKARTMGLPVVVRTNTDPEILSKIGELVEFFQEKGWTEDPCIRFLLSHVCDQHVDPEMFEQQRKLQQDVLNVMKRLELNFFKASGFRKLHSIFGKSPKFWPSFWNCNAVSKRYVFDPFGDVYPCRAMLGWKEQRIGRYIPELSFNEKYDQWRSRTIFKVGRCADCEIALMCGGGCGYASLLNTGDLFKPLCTVGEGTVVPYLEYLYEKNHETPR